MTENKIYHDRVSDTVLLINFILNSTSNNNSNSNIKINEDVKDAIKRLMYCHQEELINYSEFEKF